jgi:hypothetical protein
VQLTDAASVPLGVPVDARKGRLRFDTAADYRSSSAGKGRTQTATVGDGLFVASQKQQARAAAVTIFKIRTPARDRRACAPAKKRKKTYVVRRFSATLTKGRVEIIGARARVATRSKGRLTVEDTCSGTRVRVKSGTVAVADTHRPKRTITLRAGRSFFAKALQFAARQRRHKS